jgi:tetratricopeptide (TPR) repeat protein
LTARDGDHYRRAPTRAPCIPFRRLHPSDRSTVRPLLVCGALALGVAVIYAPVRHFGFISFDDPQYVIDNPAVESGLGWDGLVWAFGAPHAANWHPLTWLSHMLDVSLFGLDAGPHHVGNVVLHLLNALLLFAVLRAATGRDGASGFVAMVFAFHPLRVESVAWVAERKDVLSTCFWMLTLAAYVAWTRCGGARRWTLVLLAFTLGLLAKPMLVSLPVVLLLLDYWPLGRAGTRPSARRSLALAVEKAPLFVLAALAAAATVYAQGSGGAMVALDRIPPSARAANAAVSYLRYLAATVWPTRLAIFYPYRAWPAWAGWGAAAVLVATTAIAVRVAPRRPYVLVGWLWYVVTLLPVIGLVQVGSQAMADRYTYVPQIGLLIAVAWGAVDALACRPHRTAALATATAIVASACVGLSVRQVRYWADTPTLFEHALAVTQGNYLAHLSLGAVLRDQGKADEARRHYVEALRLNPMSAAAQVNVANALPAEQRAEAEAHYREALRLSPNLPEAHNGLGLLLARTGRLDEAMEHYRLAIAAKPHGAEAHANLGNALRTLGRYAEAADEYRAAIRRHPEWPDAHYALAVSLGSLGDLAGAEREYRETLRLDPTLAEADLGLGLVLEARGMSTEAIEALRAAVRLQPDWALAAEALAWALATAGNGTTEALALAERLHAAGDESPRLLDTLGAARAAAGRFADAASAARRAAALARAGGDVAFAADVEKRVALYEAGQRVRSSERVAPR